MPIVKFKPRLYTSEPLDNGKYPIVIQVSWRDHKPQIRRKLEKPVKLTTQYRSKLAVQLDPFNAGTRRSLGIVLSELNRYDEALVELEEAIRLDPKLTYAHYDLGIVLQALGKVKRAESAYRTAQKLNPNHAEAYNNLGILLAQSGDFKGAYEQFSKAVQTDPDNEEAARNLKRASEALGQNQQ
jgi:Flp pilus assembly protein TadD